VRIKAKSDAGEERFFVEATNEFTWALGNREPEHELHEVRRLRV
jgi:hypothetical protein